MEYKVALTVFVNEFYGDMPVGSFGNDVVIFNGNNIRFIYEFSDMYIHSRMRAAIGSIGREGI